MRNNKGLTMIELLAYITIVGIAAGLGIASFNLIGESALKAEARSLTSDIRYMKDLTIFNGAEHKIVFYKDKYEIVDSAGKVLKTHDFDRGVKLENYELSRGSQKVNFMSYNLDQNALASGTLIISNRKGKKMKISITPVTGRIQLSKI